MNKLQTETEIHNILSKASFQLELTISHFKNQIEISLSNSL